MELVNAHTDKQLDRIRELYLKSFPEDERKPFELLVDNSKNKKGELLCIEQNGEFLGHALTAIDGGLVLLDYFAVCEDKRSGGIGSKALAMLKERYSDKKFFLEAETLSVPCDNPEQRKRRLSFYNRCGMKETGMTVEVRGVAMEVLTYGDNISYDEYRGLYRNLFGEEIYNQVKLLSDVR